MNHIVCLKHGNKYGIEYVNKLYSMCKRNSTVPFNFSCITEIADDLDLNITHIPLPSYNITGWWFKPWVFSKEFPIKGTILFLDLDLVIINNIDHLWSYNPDQFCIIRDFNRCRIPNWNKFNSSVFRFNSDNYHFIWDNLVSDLSRIKKFHGDQDWIYDQLKHGFSFWPEKWIQSYKWEIRNKSELSNKRFKEISNPKVNPETSILVFHGEPNPHDVKDPIIVDNWR